MASQRKIEWKPRKRSKTVTKTRGNKYNRKSRRAEERELMRAWSV